MKLGLPQYTAGLQLNIELSSIKYGSNLQTLIIIVALLLTVYMMRSGFVASTELQKSSSSLKHSAYCLSLSIYHKKNKMNIAKPS